MSKPLTLRDEVETLMGRLDWLEHQDCPDECAGKAIEVFRLNQLTAFIEKRTATAVTLTKRQSAWWQKKQEEVK